MHACSAEIHFPRLDAIISPHFHRSPITIAFTREGGRMGGRVSLCEREKQKLAWLISICRRVFAASFLICADH